MISQLEIAEAKARLDELLARTRAGEEIVLADQGVPVVRLVPVESVSQDEERGFGMYKGKIWMSDDFDAPLPEEELREWEK
jgi:prevent-host-death family protein